MTKEEAYAIALKKDDTFNLCVEYKDSFMFGWYGEEEEEMIGPQPAYVFKKTGECYDILVCITNHLIEPYDVELARYVIDKNGNFIEKPIERY